MNLPPYPKYKPSGVEWLGEVPEHWETPSLYIRYQVDLGKMLNETAIRGDYLHPYLRNVDVQWYHINVSDLPQMDIGPWEIARFTVGRGDLLVCEGGEVGRAALVQNDADGLGFQKALHRLRPLAAGEDPRFMFYTLYGAAQRGVFVAGGNPNTIAHLTGEKLRGYRFPAPLAFEQRAIADFLDRETAKIDTLVAKKRTLIERLKEKRATLISRTVTRGLPPDAARAAGLDPHPNFKPSGIDWLGEVPVHWDVAQLRRRCTILDCMHRTVPFVDDGVPLASIREVHGCEVDLSDAKQTTEEEYLGLLEGGRRPRIGDILFSRNATVGDAAIVATSAPFAMGQDVCLIRCDAQHPKYVLYLLRSKPIAQQIDSFMVGATFRRINVGQIRTFWGCWPPVDEQLIATNHLDRETAILNAMVDKIETVIERLQEYRAALITAAVTGKIDIRGAVAPKEFAA